MLNNDYINIYGSISEAHRATGVSKNTVVRQMTNAVGSNRCGYYFMNYNDFLNQFNSMHTVL